MTRFSTLKISHTSSISSMRTVMVPLTKERPDTTGTLISVINFITTHLHQQHHCCTALV
nr:hypothetical protein BgiMline_000730 [Biomphalaria glabrata]